MSKLVGKDNRLRVHDGTTFRDLSNEIDSVTIDDGFDEVEVTGFTDQAHNFILGLYSGDITIAGFFNSAANKSHAVWSALVGSNTSHTVEDTLGQGAAATTGDPRWGGVSGVAYLVSKYSLNPTPAGAVKYSVTCKIASAAAAVSAPTWGTASTLAP